MAETPPYPKRLSNGYLLPLSPDGRLLVARRPGAEWLGVKASLARLPCFRGPSSVDRDILSELWSFCRSRCQYVAVAARLAWPLAARRPSHGFSCSAKENRLLFLAFIARGIAEHALHTGRPGNAIMLSHEWHGIRLTRRSTVPLFAALASRRQG